ncbi:MAG: uroporphyrinogen-III C-methyltransferase [Salinirussus sp.]
MHPGTVAIVGAGPGDPALLTVRARRRLDDADVVFHDSLVGDRVVASIPAATRVENVGKTPNEGRTPQAEINRRLVTAARNGDRVVRLKGGDPTVFGRGGEEAQHLATREIPFELVPGVSSVLAGPAAAGIPLTHRDVASSLTVITGHEDPTKADSNLDWPALANTISAGGTLVILMGVGTLPDTAATLQEHGVDSDTPAAVIERASLPGERSVDADLGEIAEAAADIRPPAVTVVGDVVSIGAMVAEWHGTEAAPAQPAAEQPPLEADGGREVR